METWSQCDLYETICSRMGGNSKPERGKTMRVLMAVAALGIEVVLADCGSAFAGGGGVLLPPAQRRAYHECLYAAWVQDYCRWNSMAANSCVIGNGGGRVLFAGRRFTDAYCWVAAQEAGR